MGKIFFTWGLIVLLALLPAVSYAAAAAAAPVAPKEKARLLMSSGYKLFQKKNFNGAAKYFYAVLKIQPENTEAWKQLGFCYYQLKNHKYAYAAFKKVLDADPDDKDAKEFMDFYGNVMDQNRKKTEKREMFSSIWRAAVMPGWGQIHNEETVKGLVIGGMFIVSLGLGIYNINDQRQKADKYLITNENHDIAYTQAEDASKAAFIWTALAIGIYIGGIVDAAMNYNAPAGRQAYIGTDGQSVMACVRQEF